MAPKMKRFGSYYDKYGAEFTISLDDLKVKARNKIQKDLRGKLKDENLAGISLYIQWFKEEETNDSKT